MSIAIKVLKLMVSPILTHGGSVCRGTVISDTNVSLIQLRISKVAVSCTRFLSMRRKSMMTIGTSHITAGAEGRG